MYVRCSKKLCLTAICLLSFSLGLIGSTMSVSAANTVKLSGESLGATITKNYFIYTDRYKSNNKIYVDIYRCNRNGTSLSNCKRIMTKQNFGGASVLETTWDSNYVWVFDSVNLKGKRWCIDITNGKTVNNSKCGVVPAYKNAAQADGSTHRGTAVYGDYNLSGYSVTNGKSNSKNKIIEYKNGKKVKIYDVGHKNESLRDVFVDGDTGYVYFTTYYKNNTGNYIKLYKAKGIKLPLYSQIKQLKVTYKFGKIAISKKKKINFPRGAIFTATNSRTVTLNVGYGKNAKPPKVKMSGKASKYYIWYWSKDKDGKSGAFDFSKPIKKNMTLYAMGNIEGSSNTLSDGSPVGCSDTAPKSVRQMLGCDSDSSSSGSSSNSGEREKSKLELAVQSILETVIRWIGSVAVIFVLIGGIQYMTSGGDVEKVRRARMTITYALIGVAVCALAFAIVNFAIRAITG